MTTNSFKIAFSIGVLQYFCNIYLSRVPGSVSRLKSLVFFLFLAKNRPKGREGKGREEGKKGRREEGKKQVLLNRGKRTSQPPAHYVNKAGVSALPPALTCSGSSRRCAP